MLSEDRKTKGSRSALSIADNLTLTNLAPFGSAGARLARRGSGARPRAGSRRSRSSAPGRRRPVGELSGGNQQKVAIARLLHHDVDVLVLDEPTRGIDVSQQGADLRADRRARRHDRSAGRRKAVLMVSSYLPELLGLCDRIAVMRRGRLQAARPVAELTEARLDDGDDDRRSARAHDGTSAARSHRHADRPGAGRARLRLLVGVAVLRARQPRADGAADGDRLHGGARHDGGHRRRRHRPVGRLDHRADHRRHRAAAAARRVARSSPALGGRRGGRRCAGWSTACSSPGCGSCRSSSRSDDADRARAAKGVADERRIEAPTTWLNDLLRRRPARSSLPSGIWLVIVVGARRVACCCTTRGSAATCSRSARTSAWRGCAASPIDRTKVIVYTLTAALAGLAGLLQFSKLSVGDPTVAVGLELDVIAAVIIGGGSLLGGRGGSSAPRSAPRS